MVRAGAPTPSKRKEKEGGAVVSTEDKAEERESKRLRDLAFSRSLLSRTRSHAHHPSFPSKTILNADGRDIVKKGHRKSKYLFAFPGLMAPVAGGKLGELTNLDSKNPVLYVEFPQGRLKLFGTIVYPKNKYLTLHFPRGAGNIVCEDCFESLIVFSNAWWIGTKEHNPEEARLPLPRSFEQDKHADVDFTAGAGQAKDFNKSARHQLEKSEAVGQSALTPKPEVSETQSSDRDTGAQITSPPVRQSARTGGKRLKYAESASDKEEDSNDSDSVESQQTLNAKGKKQLQAPNEVSNKLEMNIDDCSGVKPILIVDNDGDTPIKRTAGIGAAEKKCSVKTPTMTDFKNVMGAAKTPIKASNDKSSVLKQSRLESFCHQDPGLKEEHTTMTKEESTEVTTTIAMKGTIKSARRPRKVSKEDTEGSHSDHLDEDSDDTPLKHRKRAKKEKGAGPIKGSTPISKNSNSLKDGRTKQAKAKKEKKMATANASKEVGSASKGRKPASRSVKSSKRSSDTEEEISDPPDVSDDSDEDWAG
eukprot:c19500_g1_i3 orf=506-2104(-)